MIIFIFLYIIYIYQPTKYIRYLYYSKYHSQISKKCYMFNAYFIYIHMKILIFFLRCPHQMHNFLYTRCVYSLLLLCLKIWRYILWNLWIAEIIFYLIRNYRREPTNLVIPFSLYQIKTTYFISETISQSEYKP